MAQQARIDIETEDEDEAAAAEAESALELTDLLPEFDVTIMKLCGDNEDTDKQIDDTVSEYREDIDLDAA